MFMLKSRLRNAYYYLLSFSILVSDLVEIPGTSFRSINDVKHFDFYPDKCY